MIKFTVNDIQSIESSDLQNITEKVAWRLTTWCNYHCDYCIQNAWEEHVPQIDKLLQIAEKINSSIENDISSDVSLYLIGGEVTYIDLVRILDEKLVTKKIKKIHITTNLSASNEWWEHFINYCNSRNIRAYISASMHVSRIQNLDDFYYKAKKYCKCVSVVLNNTNYKEMEKALDGLVSSGYKGRISINLDRLTLKGSLCDDVLSIANKYRTGAGNFIVKLKDGRTFTMGKDEIQSATDGVLDFRGFYCKTWSRVEMDGTIKRGVCTFKSVMSNNINTVANDTIICESKKNCSLCSVVKIYRTNSTN